MFPEGVEGAAMRMMGPDQRYTDFRPGNMEKLIERLPTGVPPHVHAIGD